MNNQNTNFKDFKKNSKIPHYQVLSLLYKKRKWQNIENQISDTINNLKSMKIYETNEKLILVDEKIVCYDDLLLIYKNKIKTISKILKRKCNHVITNDLIDISPDISSKIIYCELCETTF